MNARERHFQKHEQLRLFEDDELVELLVDLDPDLTDDERERAVSARLRAIRGKDGVVEFTGPPAAERR